MDIVLKNRLITGMNRLHCLVFVLLVIAAKKNILSTASNPLENLGKLE